MTLASPDTAPPYLDLQGIAKVYASRDGMVRALDHVSISGRRGAFISIVGPSGCGKSTLMMIAAGLMAPSSGRVAVDGQDILAPRTEIGIVFQSPVLLEWRTALGNVMLQAEAKRLDRAPPQRRAAAPPRRGRVGGRAARLPQRVSICRALIHAPPQLLMDEPFGALDALTRDQLVLDLQRLCAERRVSVLFITHSAAGAVFLPDQVIVMPPRPGRIDRVIDIDLPRPRT